MKSQPSPSQIAVPVGEGEMSAVMTLVDMKRKELKDLEINLLNVQSQISSARHKWEMELSTLKAEWDVTKQLELEKIMQKDNEISLTLKRIQDSLFQQEQHEREALHARLKLAEQEQQNADLNTERLEIARLRMEFEAEKESQQAIIASAQEEMRQAHHVRSQAEKELLEAQRLHKEYQDGWSAVRLERESIELQRKQNEIVRKEVEARLALLKTLEAKQEELSDVKSD